jgi:hypothetical protein
MEGHVAHSSRMQTKVEVRLDTEVQVKPQTLAVVTADKQIVSAGMHGHRGNPSRVGHQLLDELLLD